MAGMQMADVNLRDVVGGDAIIGQASAGVSSAVDQLPARLRRVASAISPAFMRSSSFMR